MLQQTQVQTVIPYYEAFLARFPTVEDLAAAQLDEVLAIWSGLGYYRRARRLHSAATKIAGSGRGFPSSSRELLELPGIGHYTAAAVASIAFGEVVPVLDGNVERVLCRRLALEQDPKRSANRRRLLEAAVALLDGSRPGDSNQALMELGATVCRPKRPNCSSCPLQQGCLGRLSGDPQRFPTPRARQKVQRVELAVAVASEGDRVLLFRRPQESDLLPGMWELPNVPQARQLSAIERRLTQRFGGRWRLDPSIGKVHHSITFRALTLHVHAARFTPDELIREAPEAAWVSPIERIRFPVSSMVEKILRAALPQRPW